ncbi:hypothetical protein A5791_08460 [Mycobacterium sp. 852002-51163_SCH5372311]|uniref:hypothetical protein n=1 Tax=Mycobacterium sp. 852002-51163_SCH5372311 TaxID=1834097 RepID=UPI0007FF23DB|nr:hypothetical protein [Mycobacterium sp. 852002-51163_SCH5372311]OBF80420.1 hypothetical protein A5791_08460 [Mycobacterium sp. 852002-51163_SCH5372311]
MNKRDGRSREWLRSGRARALIFAALVVSLTLGGAFVVVSQLKPSPAEVLEHPANPVTDDQSRAQVLDAAHQIVALAGLRTTSAGYLPMSCKGRKDPPYQGAIYLTFAVPTDVAPEKYFPAIATTLVSHGWVEGPQPNGRTDGRTVSKDAVTAIVYRDSDDPSLGVLRLYGECRNMNDHRHDGWTDVADQLTAQR